jgi:hypothetical protein
MAGACHGGAVSKLNPRHIQETTMSNESIAPRNPFADIAPALAD